MRTSISRKPKSADAPPAPLVVSVKQAAQLLAVCEKSVWRLAKRGEIQTRRIGARVLFPVKSLQEFVAGADTK